MVMYVYSIYDKVADESGPLFTAKNHSVAMRQYRAVLKDSPAAEYDLLCVGEVEQSGHIALKAYDQVVSVEEVSK